MYSKINYVFFDTIDAEVRVERIVTDEGEAILGIDVKGAGSDILESISCSGDLQTIDILIKSLTQIRNSLVEGTHNG
jgi:hypothetical protein